MDGVPSWAVKGAKCICIGGRNTEAAIPLSAGQELTVRGSFEGVPGSWIDQSVLYFEEVVNDDCVSGYEIGYDPARFRPVRTLESDLETHFYQYLNTGMPVTTKQRERA